MAIATAQWVDLLVKKLFGVAKTAPESEKSPSNEAIASPAFIRGDIIWMQSDEITSSAGPISGVANARTGANAVQCTGDNTSSNISGTYQTWKSNVNYWIPQEFGATWLPKVFVGAPAAANIEATGTQIFAAGSGGTGEYYFDTQAGVLNFIGGTIPTVLSGNVSNVVYISGYEYIGDLGVGNISSANIGNLNITDTTISTITGNANIYIDPNGSGTFEIVGTNGFVIPVGTTGDRPGSPTQGLLRFNSTTNQLEIWDGSEWDVMGSQAVITNQQITPDGSSATYTLDQEATADGILVNMNGVSQTPGVDYTVTGNQITFTTTPLTTDIVQVRFIASVATISGLTNSTANSSVTVTNTPSINFEVNSTVIAQFDENEVLDISGCHSLQLPTYTVSEATSLSNVTTGQLIYVSNGDSGNPCLAVYSGGTFKRVSLGSTIST